MQVDVLEVTEQPDGSARIVVDLDEEALSLIIEGFMVQAIAEQIKTHEKGPQK